MTYKVAIVGAGPIGIELAVALKKFGITYIQFDAQQIGYTMTWWPRNTNFFSTSERIAIAGVPIQNNHQGRITGEDYLFYLRAIIEQFDLQVNCYEKVTRIERADGLFTLTTQTLRGEQTYQAENVVLAKGDMDKPNLLNIPGEDLPHVTHYFSDPHNYFQQRVLVVGGRNSAVETALRCWRGGAQVAISYRQGQFSKRVKDHIRPDVEAQIENGNIKFYGETVPTAITLEHVKLQPTRDGQVVSDAPPIIHPTDFVILNTGFQADMSLLEEAGVTLNGDLRVPTYNEATMETDVPRLYLAGTTAAGERQFSYRLFVENCHIHVAKIVKAITGRPPERIGTVPARNYEMELFQFEAN